MENETSNLLTKLQSFDSKEEIINYVNEIHLEIKNKLFKQGVKFHEEESIFYRGINYNEVIPSIINKSNLYLYEEINHIRQGLNRNWVDMMSQRERFDPIKHKVEELIHNKLS